MKWYELLLLILLLSPASIGYMLILIYEIKRRKEDEKLEREIIRRFKGSNEK